MTGLSRLARSTLQIAFIAALLAAAPLAPAVADSDDWYHHRHGNSHANGPTFYFYDSSPTYYYAPPPAPYYFAPPPAVYSYAPQPPVYYGAPTIGFGITIPLNGR